MAFDTDTYLSNLRYRASQVTGRAPDITDDPQNPNDQITKQQSLESGNVVQPQYNPFATFDAQKELTDQNGQTATQLAQDQYNQRQQQNNSSFQNISDSSGVGGGTNTDNYANNDVMANAQTIFNIGRSRGLSDQDIQAGLAAGLAESGLHNLNGGDRDSLGLFQQRPSQGWGSQQQIMDPTYATNKFFDAFENSPRGANLWNTIQNTQRSAFSDGSNYQAQWGRAQQIFNQLNNPSSGLHYDSSSPQRINPQQQQGLSNWINQHNNKYLDYDGVYGAQCVDLYAYYTSGFVGGRPNPVGYAPEIYNNYDQSAYQRYNAGSQAHMGDVAIWGQGPYTPSGHVAIVIGDNGNGTLRVLQANARGFANPSDPRNTSIISNISKAALMGYLRPRRLM